MDKGRRILVAYDGSELSEKAVLEAKNQTRIKSGSVIHIISIVTPGGAIGGGSVSSGSLTMNEAEEMITKLDSLVESLKLSSIVAKKEVITDFSQKNPGIAICEYAEENNIDQIIVGSRGLSSWKKIFLGSVSTAIVERATSQVLVIK